MHIIILNWNGLEDTLVCLNSLTHLQTFGHPIHIVVVDNGSEINPIAILQQHYPKIKVIRLENNCGFAGGCNVGINHALSENTSAVLLLNNDTLVSDDLLMKLCTDMSLDNVAQLHELRAPVVWDMQDKSRITFAGGDINLATGAFTHRQCSEAHLQHMPQKINCDYVTGACLLIPRAVLDEIGQFDASFFAYCEDVEYCLRARQAHISRICIRDAKIWHNESASTRRNLNEGTHSPFKHYLLIRNQIWVVRHYANGAQKLLYFGLFLPARLLYYTAGFVIRQRWQKLRAVSRGVMDGIRPQKTNRFV
jgi:hypothetical protein